MSKLNDLGNGPVIETRPNVLLGVIGATVGALVGAAMWVGLYQLGVIASAAGVAIIYLACKGYSLLSKSKDLKGVVIATAISVVVLLAAHFLCWGLEIYSVYSVNYDITLLDAILEVPSLAFTEDYIIDFCKELLIGLILIGLGVAPFVKSARNGSSEERAA